MPSAANEKATGPDPLTLTSPASPAVGPFAWRASTVRGLWKNSVTPCHGAERGAVVEVGCFRSRAPTGCVSLSPWPHRILAWQQERRRFQRLSTLGREGFEPSTLGLRVPCSTS